MAARKLIRVRPYHAAAQAAPSDDPAVPSPWHDRSDCEQGRWIPSGRLRAGSGPGERCPECARLDRVAPIDPSDDGAATRRAATSVPATPKIQRVAVKEPRRPRLTTLLGVAASALLAVLAGLLLSGRLEPGDDERAAPRASTSTTRKAAAPAGTGTVPGTTAPTVPPAPPAPAPAVQEEAESSEPTTGGSFYLAADGYTHGTEADGEVCSGNPDDSQFPCSQQVPGSGGFGSPLPEDATEASGAPAPGVRPGRGPAVARDPAARAAAREQRRAARRALRSSRRP